MLNLDLSKLNGFLPEDYVSSRQAGLEKAAAMLANHDGPGGDYTGWVYLPRDYDKEEFARIKAAAKKIQQQSKVLVVIGIGGSYLGARAVIELLASPNYNLKQKDTPDVFFAGAGLSTDALLELIALIGDRDFSVNVISKSGTTTEPAVAFRIFKAMLEEKYGKDPEALMHLTCATGVIVGDAIVRIGKPMPGIKWTNDLVLGKRKLGGILTEISVDPATGKVAWAIIGIGINCCQKDGNFPPEIQNIAISLGISPQDRPQLAVELIRALHQMRQHLFAEKAGYMEDFRHRCVTIGQQISILRADDVSHGTALSVDDDGGLLVRLTDGTLTTVTSGEVSIRGMYGYL